MADTDKRQDGANDIPRHAETDKQLKFEEILADPEFRKLLDAEVRANVGERLRLRTYFQIGLMTVALAFGIAGIVLSERDHSDFHSVEQLLSDTKSKADSLKETAGQVHENMTQVVGVFNSVAAANSKKKK
jgi:hypothetical protein